MERMYLHRILKDQSRWQYETRTFVSWMNKNWKTSPCLMERMMISKIPNETWSIEDEDKTVEGNGRKSKKI